MVAPEKTFELVITPDDFDVHRLGTGHIGVLVRTPAVDALLPAGRLMLRMTPTEARALSGTLLSWAEAFDGGAPGGQQS